MSHNSISPVPESFAALMEMYEINYIRLRVLCGDIQRLPDMSISKVPSGVPVQLKIIERSKHTTTMIVTYCFTHKPSITHDFSNNSQDNGQKQSACNVEHHRPNLQIRVYHDAQQAEVVSRQCRLTGKNRRLWDLRGDNVLVCRWRLNRFLYKWSGYLHRQGHSFSQ